MGKVLDFITPVAHRLQSLSAKISGVNHEWVVLAAIIVVLGVMVIALDRSKSTKWILAVYALGFVALQIPVVAEYVKKSAGEADFKYLQIIVGALPILALGVQKFKKKRSSGGSSIYSRVRRTHRSEY